MAYKEFPEHLIERVEPKTLDAYLLATGWQKATGFPDSVAVFRSSDGSSEIVVPLDKEFGDYVDRLSDSIKVLAEHEKRTPLDILEDLLTPSDIVSFSVNDPSIENGIIPLHLAVRILDASKRMLNLFNPPSSAFRLWTAIGHSYGEFIPMFGNLGNLCRIETEASAFRVSFVYPVRTGGGAGGAGLLAALVSGAVNAFSIEDKIEPHYGRAQIERIISAIDATVKALKEDELHRLRSPHISDPSEHLENDSFIANVCDVLLDMRPPTEGGSLSIQCRFAWPFPMEKMKISIDVSSGLFGSIQDLTNEFFAEEEIRDAYYVGRVQMIGNADKGEVFLKLLEPGSDRLISAIVELKPFDFKHAQHAFKEGVSVAVIGELQKLRPVNRVRSYKLFQVLAPLNMGEGIPIF